MPPAFTYQVNLYLVTTVFIVKDAALLENMTETR